MKTRTILKNITVAIMLLIGLGFMIFPSYVSNWEVMISGFLFFILGLRSIFYTLEGNEKIWKWLDDYIQKGITKKQYGRHDRNQKKFHKQVAEVTKILEESGFFEI